MRMLGSLVIVTPSSAEPVELEEAKLWLKIEPEETADDETVSRLIKTARNKYKQFSNRVVGSPEVYDWYLDDFPCSDDPLEPPRYPLISIGSIRGFSTTDASDTGGSAMNAASYYVDVASEPGRVMPVSGATWPTATRNINAVIVRFTAGYSSSQGWPDSAKTTILGMIAAGYEFRGDDAQLSAAMDDLLAQDELALPELG